MNGKMLLGRFVFFCLVSISLYNTSISSVDAANFPSRLLNAKRTPLRALSTPGNFYFLEFPVNEVDSNISPICADGSPFSFAFRRGTDEHLSKVLIEFEGGPACWSDGSTSCCDVKPEDARKQVPWYNYYDFFRDQIVFQKTFPEIGSCRGVASGFLTEAVDVILSNGNGMRNDLPIPLRDDEGEGWWKSLGGEGSDIRDWSYILIPHCSMDWHLGHQENPQLTSYCSVNPNSSTDALYHRGGTNVDAVIRWVQEQFPSGLDALVTTAGGKVGGCSDDLGPSTASSIAPAILAAKLTPEQNDEDDTSSSQPSTLVVTEGSGLFDPNLPSPNLMGYRWNALDLPANEDLPGTMERLISSSSNTQYIWMASEEGKASNEESLWFIQQTDKYSDEFHLYEPQSTQGDVCPLYTFPDSDTDLSEFFEKVIENMSWSSTSAQSESSSSTETSLAYSYGTDTDDKPRSKLSFLTISILVAGLVVLAWIVYFIVKRNNFRQGKKAPLSPTDIWFIALTNYPLAFYFVSLLVPILLSTLAFYQNEIKINLDFDSYLQVNTDLENVKRNYNEAQQSQQASLDMEAFMCQSYGNSLFGNRKLLDELEPDEQRDYEFLHIEESMFGNENQLDNLDIDIQYGQKLPLDMISLEHQELHRELSTLNYFSGGEWISIMYQNRKGGNVFEPEVLKAIHEFESTIYEFPGFEDYCYGFGSKKCLPIDSLATYFFNNGEFVSNPNGILRSFLLNKPALWKLDQYFAPDNLESNVMRSFVFLKDVGGDQSAAHPFLRRFYRDFLLKHDQKKTYPAMIHTWNNFILKQTEADDALFHDTLWSIGSLCFIAIMILLKVQSFFVVASSMLGLVLAFSVAYYWVSAHFMIQDITLIWVAGLFVMLGIGADDIFLMVDSFEHTKHEFEGESKSLGFHSDIKAGNDDNNIGRTRIEILQQRMKVAYMRAGSMMLVSSVTTAICFFSNAFGVLTVIQEFGIFMGMVVLINYLHVMTILPSSILVNEIYLIPFRKEIMSCFKGKSSSENLDKSASIEYQNGEPSNDMNRLDRYLVDTYAPLVSRRSSYFIALPVVLAIVLGVFGSLNFTMNDGTIVLYSERYNLGRLQSVTDRYFNDDEDVFTTIEKDVPTPTFAPKFTPSPTASIPPMDDNNTYIFFDTDINFIPPEEALEQGLPGAIAPPPNGSSQEGESATSGESGEQIEDSSSNTASEAVTGGATEGEQTEDSTSNQASEAVGGDATEEEQTEDSTSDQASEAATGDLTGGETPELHFGGTVSRDQIISSGGSPSSTSGETCTGSSCPGSASKPNNATSHHTFFGGALPSSDGSSSSGSGELGTDSSSPGSTPKPSTVISSSDLNAEDDTTMSKSKDKSNQDDNVGFVPQPTSDDGLRRRETIQVKLIWGVATTGKKLNLWMTNTEDKSSEMQNGESKPLNLADPNTQQWLLEVVEMAKSKPHLFVRADKLTWIERLKDFAKYAGVQFPIPEHLFSTYVQLFKLKDPSFAKLIQNAIGTNAPGLGGDYTFTSVTMMVDMVENEKAAQNISISEKIYTEWTEFAQEANELAPSDIPDVVSQSSIFLDAYRVEATIDSTLVTWFVANGLCLLVILVFIQNLALSFMVMVTIILILFCLGGLLFAIYRVPFGPVEALGVSIFIGLSANYSLHVVHAYHHSKSSDRASKIKDAAFAVGSPIIASALSTMGASAFLFGCRTWVFIELGLLICSITAMALLYTMTFLFAWLAATGPVPIFENDPNHVHQWDLKALCHKSAGKGNPSPTALTELELYNDKTGDNASVYSIEIVDDSETNLAPAANKKTSSTIGLADIMEADYDIEIVEEIENDAPQPEERSLKNSPPRTAAENREETLEEDQWVYKRPSVRSMLLPPKPTAETANGSKVAVSMFV